ncbi:unnamed protein product [Leuciscus chuanchicus]
MVNPDVVLHAMSSGYPLSWNYNKKLPFCLQDAETENTPCIRLCVLRAELTRLQAKARAHEDSFDDSEICHRGHTNRASDVTAQHARPIHSRRTRSARETSPDFPCAKLQERT